MLFSLWVLVSAYQFGHGSGAVVSEAVPFLIVSRFAEVRRIMIRSSLMSQLYIVLQGFVAFAMRKKALGTPPVNHMLQVVRAPGLLFYSSEIELEGGTTLMPTWKRQLHCLC